MPFDVPRHRIVAVDSIDVRLDPGIHPFETSHAAEIDAHWASAAAANPALFDGQVMLHAALACRDGRLVGRCHAVRFATLLYWIRHHRGPSSAEHAFAHAALVTSDNALVAVRMGAHTSTAGAVYFAAGSFELPDFPGGHVDVDLNMAREVKEETGIDISTLRRDPGYHLYSDDGGSVIFRRYYLSESADNVARGIEAFVAAEAEPEIIGPVVIRSPDDLPEGIKPHMVQIVRWHFGPGPSATPAKP